MNSHDAPTHAVAGGAAHPGLLGKLMAAIRPEFRADVFSFDPADPVFGGPLCDVPGCRRPARSRGFCTGHHARWRQLGKPGPDAFAATTKPRFAREVMACCQAPGCGYGVNGHGLCGRHLSRWRQGGAPELARWLACLPPVAHQPPPSCRVPGCSLWAQPSWPLCRSHARSWIYHGRPDITDYLTRFRDHDDGVPAYEHIDLRGLPVGVKLEIQYVLQRRRDEETITTENDNPIWPHCDGLIWPHLGSCGDGC